MVTADLDACSKAVVLAASLYMCYPHTTTDASASENANLLYRIVDDRLGAKMQLTNMIMLEVDYFPDLTNPTGRYEMGYTMYFGDMDLGNTRVASFGFDRLHLFPEETVPMSIPVEGLTENIRRYTLFCRGKVPWELTDEEMMKWKECRI